jgi:hypothetical protein
VSEPVRVEFSREEAEALLTSLRTATLAIEESSAPDAGLQLVALTGRLREALDEADEREQRAASVRHEGPVLGDEVPGRRSGHSS